ncbi:hypothetical protein SLEP1_g29549 [Rubroshorea leprosula]|uniref:Gnk2-homologous domain-containing protein n=1 Tax=Rubroshorea leprosula TaxID=152421 RepID=A0AAV5JXA3_9ROSI|nr:hypothetical protein SLEP1_g29549 [Rubroshorea leprosula]
MATLLMASDKWWEPRPGDQHNRILQGRPTAGCLPYLSQRHHLELQQNCTNYKEAIGWSDFYTLHYANRLISRVDPEVNPFIIRPTGTTSDDQFNQAVSSLLSRLTSQVATGTGGSLQNYAAGDNGSGIYALVQCTLFLSSEECSSCLETAIGKMPGTTGCKGMTRCRVLLPSCNLRYETYSFIGTVPSPSSTAPPSPSPQGKAEDVPQPSPFPSSPPPPKGKVGWCSWPPPLPFAVFFS